MKNIIEVEDVVLSFFNQRKFEESHSNCKFHEEAEKDKVIRCRMVKDQIMTGDMTKVKLTIIIVVINFVIILESYVEIKFKEHAHNVEQDFKSQTICVRVCGARTKTPIFVRQRVDSIYSIWFSSN